MKLVLQLIFLLFINFALSQKYRVATIFFNDSTSVKGFGEINNNTIYFKVRQEDKSEKWGYDIAKGLTFSEYGFSEKYEYVKFEKQSKPRIMEVVEEGNVTLYRDAKLFYTGNVNFNAGSPPTNVSTFANMSVTFYVKRKTEEYATDIIFSFKTRAKRYFSDCKKIIEKIDNRNFTKKNIADMVFYYNEYCGENED